jgi:glycosyltransferase involved in cell wall biosynthesis
VGSAVKILILSFYYDPDLSAGSFRATALVRALERQLSDDDEIHVVTTLPNRYSSFVAEAPVLAESGRVKVRRMALPRHKGAMVDQARAFLAFAVGTLRVTRDEHYAIVVATSSRLMTAVLGARIAAQKRTALYLDIRDIFVDTIKDVLSPAAALATRPAFSALEGYALTRATKVNLVSEGFRKYFGDRYPRNAYSFFTNGIDGEFVRAGSSPSHTAEAPFTIVYAGNTGEGQGLHSVIPALALAMRERIRFKVIGDGGRHAQLVERLAAANVTNVELLPPMSRLNLIEEYDRSDVLFLHLNNHKAFRKVLPSKIFEYAAIGKPIWAGVAGYAAEFLESNVSNAAVFPPCDVPSAVRAFDKLKIAFTPRPEFVARFSRDAIASAMAADILETARAHV